MILHGAVSYTHLDVYKRQKYETLENSGISHFLEHMLFKGTANRKTALEVIEPIDEIGGIANAFTGEELSLIHI